MATKPHSGPTVKRHEILIIAASTAALTITFWLLSIALGRADGAHAPVAGRDIALPIHTAAALLALPLGAYVLWRPKGTRLHVTLGRVWAVLMLAVAISSYWLRTLTGGFSFIHLLSVLTLVSIPLAIYNARRGNIRAHLRAMRGVYVGLVVAGVFAALPGRTLGNLMFG